MNLLYIHSQDVLGTELRKAVEYECHSFSYYTLLEVIIGLSSTLNLLQKVTFPPSIACTALPLLT